MTNRIIIVIGQTATGKTNLALELAQKYDGELINCDSRQIYKHLDIITGKDVMHRKVWLYDIVDPKLYFSSFDYQRRALIVIKKLLKAGRTPVIVGGSHFYLYHLLYGVETENIPSNWQLRKELGKKSIVELQTIYEDLRKKSINLPAFLAGRLNNSEKNNPQRLIRKIEIVSYQSRDVINHVSTKKRSSSVETRHASSLQRKLNLSNLELDFICLKFKNKQSLKKTIKKRVEQRLKAGAIDEVKKLIRMGYTSDDPGLKTIGYQQIMQYLKGDYSKDQAIKVWINKEVQYANRQYTYLKKYFPFAKWRLV